MKARRDEFIFILHPSAFILSMWPDSGLTATHGNLDTVAPFPAWRGSRSSPLCGARSL